MARGLRAAAAIIGIAGLLSTQAALAEPSLNDLAARTELRPIETLTLSDQQFLTGDKNGKAVTIAGELRIPRGVNGRMPAVVLAASMAATSCGPSTSTRWGSRRSCSTASRREASSARRPTRRCLAAST